MQNIATHSVHFETTASPSRSGQFAIVPPGLNLLATYHDDLPAPQRSDAPFCEHLAQVHTYRLLGTASAVLLKSPSRFIPV